MNSLVGPVWRLWIPDREGELHLFCMPANDDRPFSRGLSQMINPKLVVKIGFLGHEWEVLFAKNGHQPPFDHEFAGHTMHSFVVRRGLYDQVVDHPLDWEIMNVPRGLELEYVDGTVFEPFVCTMEEFLGCSEVPTCLRLVSNA